MPRGSKSGERRGGRQAGTPNKATAALKAVAGQYTEEAVTTLVAIMRDVEMPPQARVGACRELLDRGHGKPAQAITGPEGEALRVPMAVEYLLSVQPA